MGWSGLKYGELLAAAEGKFDVFIATDKNLRHQQNLTKYKLAVILLPSNSVPVVVAVTADIEAALVTIQARDFVEILAPTVQVIPADIVPRVDSFKGLISKNGRVAR